MTVEISTLCAQMFVVNLLKLKESQLKGDSNAVVELENKNMQVYVLPLQPLLGKI